MTSREVFLRTIEFRDPERVAMTLLKEYGNDVYSINMSPSTDYRPSGGSGGSDEWGAVWENIGISKVGEVKKVPLERWEDWDKLNVPDVLAPHRWQHLYEHTFTPAERDRFCIAGGLSLYARIHYVRGLENTWTDIYLYPDELRRMINLLVEMNLKAIGRYQQFPVDGYMFCDDWGLQDKLMIAPDSWREFWKPAYARVFAAAHAAGMKTILHSCGHIVAILDDLIDCGLDVIQMDQQQNMGLDALSRFAGRITFWCPVDIQNMMCRGTPEAIGDYARQMFSTLATTHGGFIAGYYGDPVGAGHSPQAIKAASEAFCQLRYPQP